MNKEELLALGLSEEMVGKVLEKYDHMIPKTRLDEVITERNDLREQITKRDEQLKELSKQVKDVKIDFIKPFFLTLQSFVLRLSRLLVLLF